MNRSDDVLHQPQPIQQNPTNFFKSSKPLAIFTAVLFITVTPGIGGYLLGARTSPRTEKTIKTNIPTPAIEEKNASHTNYDERSSDGSRAIIEDALPTLTPYPTYQPDPAVVARVPADWIFVKSEKCNVLFPLLPKKPPYYREIDSSTYPPSRIDDNDSGRFWQFEEYGSFEDYSSGDGNVTTRTIYRAADEDGSELVAAAVEVTCWFNTNSHTTKTWAMHFEQLVLNNPATKVESKQDDNMWGKRVTIGQFVGGLYGIYGDDSYYLFATEKHTYKIRTVIGSTTKLTRDTTNKILNNLVFLDRN
jgi:hypothetical protein